MAEVKFDYNSRSKYTKTHFSAWENSVASKVKKFNSEETEIYKDAILIGRSSGMGSKLIKEKLDRFLEKSGNVNPLIKLIKKPNNNAPLLSEFFKKDLKFLVDIFVPEKYTSDFYSFVDEMINFQYSLGWDRRSVRSKSIRLHYLSAIKLMYSYMTFNTYGVSVADFICDKLSPEALDYKRSSNGNYGDLCLNSLDGIIAARINADDKAVISAIKESFLSENNNIVVTNDIIRAVIKSKNKELHELLGKFLIAARLSEGLRQAICEAADCGCPESFIVILDAIKSENLIRFAAVKRAISTWCGITYFDDMDRHMGKILEEMHKAVHDLNYARDLTTTEDSVKIIVGLWAIGFYSIEDAISHVIDIAKTATRQQLLAISYFNNSVKDDRLSSIVSYDVFEKYNDDLEVIAAFMYTYISGASGVVASTFELAKGGSRYRSFDADYIYHDLDLKELFDSKEQALKHYAILKACAESMKKRTIDFAPCIFPWLKVVAQKSDFIIRMALIAYALKDNDLIDEVSQKISDIDGGYSTRSDVLRMLLHKPQTEIQQQALLNAIADKAEYTHQTAYGIVSKMKLSSEDYKKLEGFLKYKNEEIRKNVIDLLKKQNDKALSESCVRLIASSKPEIRLAGFDIIKTTMDEEPSKKESFKAAISGIDEASLTEQEKVLYNQIIGIDSNEETSSDNGYGLYTDETSFDVAPAKADLKKIKDYFSCSQKEIQSVFDALFNFFKENATKEYVDWNGTTRLLGNGLCISTRNYKAPIHETYPFPELWEKFYDEHIKSEKLFWNVRVILENSFTDKIIEEYDLFRKAEKELFPYTVNDITFYFSTLTEYKHNISDYTTALNCMHSVKGFNFPKDIAKECVKYAAGLEDKYKWYTEYLTEYRRSYGSVPERKFFTETQRFAIAKHALYNWKNDEEFKESFSLLRMLDQSYKYQELTSGPAYRREYLHNNLTTFMFIKACECGLISEDMIYKYALVEIPVSTSVSQLSSFAGNPNLQQLRSFCAFMDCDLDKKTYDSEAPFYKLGQKIIAEITKLILSYELKRGDTETEFSNASLKLSAVYGIDTLVDILTALGKDTLDRSTYYFYSSGTGRKQCLSHLLQCCQPLETDTAEYFGKKIKEKKISEDRVIEVAMYAPQWLDIIEEYLGCEGFKSGCYYFMAHMNERFDEKRKAMIAKYTPLSPEELNGGAFDVDWFKDAYSKLGDKMFQKLYKAAKYISDGSKHSRARKYADAATGLVDRDELEKTINDKRNQDLLMSYGIIPIKDEADEIHRYEYIQKFRKESKKFGSQRRASEGNACDMSLKNMATVAGYSDSLRLILAMETAIVLSNQRFFDGITVGEYNFGVAIGDQGKAELTITKDGKKIKSVPAALKKDENVVEIKDFISKLKDQYSRSAKMFENAMEERDLYSFGELKKLCTNPVIATILERLVFQDENNNLGLLEEFNLDLDSKLNVAHPFDLYKSGEWSKWQQIFFDKAQKDGIKQPFKQVFRELYIKLDEEKDQTNSKLFAGNQIQPKKTLAVLKSRRWIADYEEGLQKIYYKDNIIATIYALADWFSPADTEEPTLEYVQFYDRKTFKTLKISEIPDVIYSEIMRDVDLAVSVAHAGGVDPETSHSTIEMRAVIAAFNIQLFKLKNVQIEGTHAIIDGTHGKYSVHLGSGVVHKMGSHMINILPVHSQSRGKIFLPFIDEDPKTAEIISKIILLSEDNKIKDPFIMDQILK